MAQTRLAPAEGFNAAPKVERPLVRRFELADFNRHMWLRDRVHKICPHMQPHVVESFLRSQLYSPEFLFMFMPHAVGLAQVIRTTVFEPTPIIMERFVFAENPANEEHVLEAVDFYAEMTRWAHNQGATKMIVLQHSDVPMEMADKIFGKRVLEVRQLIADIDPKRRPGLPKEKPADDQADLQKGAA